MKKIGIIAILICWTISNVFAIHEKYEDGYSMEPSVVNTKGNETAMSFLKGKVVYSLIDSLGSIKIYSATINDTINELHKPQEEPELKKLGIHGTFGFDEAKNKIYFSRYEKSTKGYMLYESTLSDKNKWSKPKRLKIEGIDSYRKEGSPLVNAGWEYRAPGISGFYNPTLAENGTRIYFTGEFSQGEGELDLWSIDLNGKKWTMPQNLGDLVNTQAKEDYAFVVEDKLLYFATMNESKGGYDLMVSERKDNEWTAPTSLGGGFNSSADDYNLIGTNKSIFFISGRTPGYGDDIYRPQRLALEEILLLEEPNPEEEPIIQTKTFPWKMFYFDFDKYVLTLEFQKEVDELYAVMQDFMYEYDFVISGHTDSRGSDAYNDRLSIRRATTVYNMLVQRGIPARKMKIEGFGERQPVVPNAKTSEEHAENRRVVVDIVRK